MSALTDALVGKFVHVPRAEDDGQLRLLHQGRILAADDTYVLLDLDVVGDGGPRVAGLVPIAELAERGAFFYDTAEDMHRGYERFSEDTGEVH